MLRSRRAPSARRLVLLLAAILIAAPVFGAHAPPAAAASSTLSLAIRGAGRVTEVTGHGMPTCATPDTTSSTTRMFCTNYTFGGGATVELAATPAPGYRFAGWQGTNSPEPVHCDSADGSHFLASGNCRFWFPVWPFEKDLGLEARFVDDTPPQTTISGTPASPTRNRTATFNFFADQTGSTFRCRLDGGGFNSCGSGQTYTNLVDGPHTFAVFAVDPSGNEDPTPDSRTWTVDTTPPETTITSGPDGPTSSQSAEFRFTSNEANSTFRCKLDSGAETACVSGKTYTGLAHGPHTFQVAAFDLAGNPDSDAASRTWTVDIEGPVLTINGPAALTRNPTATFAVTWDDAVTKECSLDGGAWSACPSPLAFTVDDGAHNLRARGTDALGNTGSTVSWNWTVDTTRPSGTIAINGGKARTASRTVTLTLAATDPDPGSGVVQMRFRNKGTTTWSSWQPFATTASWRLTRGAGIKTVQVQFRDAAGNISPIASDAIRYQP